MINSLAVYFNGCWYLFLLHIVLAIAVYSCLSNYLRILRFIVLGFHLSVPETKVSRMSLYSFVSFFCSCFSIRHFNSYRSSFSSVYLFLPFLPFTFRRSLCYHDCWLTYLCIYSKHRLCFICSFPVICFNSAYTRTLPIRRNISYSIFSGTSCPILIPLIYFKTFSVKYIGIGLLFSLLFACFLSLYVRHMFCCLWNSLFCSLVIYSSSWSY